MPARPVPDELPVSDASESANGSWITGAAVSVSDSRIDFDMSETADKAELSDAMMAIVNALRMAIAVLSQYLKMELLSLNGMNTGLIVGEMLIWGRKRI